ncbi:MAG TPA: hydantoinase/oxoprolinase family protein, partial [Beijerinckiaceae bacterium]|nr:hydantoinase/oxoprolinase family protein [Beijerinckiaceae bacterium]
LKIDTVDAAEGIVRIIDVKMQEAIKAISTMRGHDLRDFQLLAFGGAGPLHACRIAEDLGIAGVVVPLYPGVYSAMGLVMSDVKHDYIRSRLMALGKVSASDLNAIFADMAAQARAELAAEGFSSDRITIEPALDMRYAGQGYEMTIACAMPLADGALGDLRARFDIEHKQMFGHAAPDETVEIVSYRLRGIGRVPPVNLPRFTPKGMPLDEALRERRAARFNGVTIDCPVFQREKLDVGVRFEGPAIIDQLDCTSVIPPGHKARVDDYKNILVSIGGV